MEKTSIQYDFFTNVFKSLKIFFPNDSSKEFQRDFFKNLEMSSKKLNNFLHNFEDDESKNFLFDKSTEITKEKLIKITRSIISKDEVSNLPSEILNEELAFTIETISFIIFHFGGLLNININQICEMNIYTISDLKEKIFLNEMITNVIESNYSYIPFIIILLLSNLYGKYYLNIGIALNAFNQTIFSHSNILLLSSLCLFILIAKRTKSNPLLKQVNSFCNLPIYVFNNNPSKNSAEKLYNIYFHNFFKTQFISLFEDFIHFVVNTEIRLNAIEIINFTNLNDSKNHDLLPKYYSFELLKEIEKIIMDRLNKIMNLNEHNQVIPHIYYIIDNNSYDHRKVKEIIDFISSFKRDSLFLNYFSIDKSLIDISTIFLKFSNEFAKYSHKEINFDSIAKIVVNKLNTTINIFMDEFDPAINRYDEVFLFFENILKSNIIPKSTEIIIKFRSEFESYNSHLKRNNTYPILVKHLFLMNRITVQPKVCMNYHICKYFHEQNPKEIFITKNIKSHKWYYNKILAEIKILEIPLYFYEILQEILASNFYDCFIMSDYRSFFHDVVSNSICIFDSGEILNFDIYVADLKKSLNPDKIIELSIKLRKKFFKKCEICLFFLNLDSFEYFMDYYNNWFISADSDNQNSWRNLFQKIFLIEDSKITKGKYLIIESNIISIINIEEKNENKISDLNCLCEEYKDLIILARNISQKMNMLIENFNLYYSLFNKTRSLCFENYLINLNSEYLTIYKIGEMEKIWSIFDIIDNFSKSSLYSSMILVKIKDYDRIFRSIINLVTCGNIISNKKDDLNLSVNDLKTVTFQEKFVQNFAAINSNNLNFIFIAGQENFSLIIDSLLNNFIEFSEFYIPKIFLFTDKINMNEFKQSFLENPKKLFIDSLEIFNFKDFSSNEKVKFNRMENKFIHLVEYLVSTCTNCYREKVTYNKKIQKQVFYLMYSIKTNTILYRLKRKAILANILKFFNRYVEISEYDCSQ